MNKYLLDTNIIFELLFGRSKADDVFTFIKSIPSDNLFLSDFSYHSIGVILYSRGLHLLFNDITDDLFRSGGMTILSLSPIHTSSITQASIQYTLDFDDTYQYPGMGE